MGKAEKVECELGKRLFVIEAGWLAKQANGAVLVSYADTSVLVTAVCGEPQTERVAEEGVFPLTVDYREKTIAAGKFPGGFIKREGRPTTKETLTCRLIDRPLRPLFPDGFTHEIQIMANVLSADQQNDSDVLAMNAASAALTVSDIPFNGPVGAVRVGLIDGNFILSPTLDELKESQLDLVVSGTHDSIIMVEGSAREVDEQKLVDALMFAHKHIQQLVQLQLQLRDRCGKSKMSFTPLALPEKLYARLSKKYLESLKAVFFTPIKKNRSKAMRVVLEKMIAEEDSEKAESLAVSKQENVPLPLQVKMAYDRMETELVRHFALEGKRADGRDLRDIRPIEISVGLLPRTHGSALFTRGETQALVTIALGTQDDEQIVDGLHEEYSKKFMLHYNFPPFSVGEIKPNRGPGRREIGHGTLAERALEAVIPPPEDFPYTIRIVSDILESNGSSSMASVCGGTLALMDAGVPIKASVTGIAMGLIKEGTRFVILSDILGSEDAHGDMDFKVAGTEKGVTAVQMDLKTAGISFDIMKVALEQAREGRLFVMEKMHKAIAAPRSDLSPHAPRLVQIKIDPDKIGLIIGSGGATIREIQTNTNTKIEITDDGMVTIASKDAQALQAAKEIIEAMTGELEVGRIYHAKVVSLKDFGAFIEIIPSKHEGLVHVSELSEGYVRNVEDAVQLGQEVDVKLLSIDEQGRARFSIKAVQTEAGRSSTSEKGVLRSPRKEDLVVGQIYSAKITGIKEYGAFVQILSSEHKGLVHISELSDEQVRRPGDAVSVGQEVKVKLLAIDDQGRLRFSIKATKEDDAIETLKE